MMFEENKYDRVFNIKRLKPEEVQTILKCQRKKKAMLLAKSYNITSDNQRFELVKLVLSKEMIIKEVA